MIYILWIEVYAPSRVFEELGARLFSLIFKVRLTQEPSGGQKNIYEKLYSLLGKLDNGRIRLLFDVKTAELNQIPWETLYLPQKNVFPALTGKQFSIIRTIDLQDELGLNQESSDVFRYRTFFSPLKILLVSANPKDLSYLNSFQEIEAIKESLSEASRKQLVVVRELKGATIESLKSEILNFKPHLFHFGGHGTYLTDESQGALVLQKEGDDTKDIVPIKRIIDILAKDTEIVLAVLNGCDTGSSYTEDIYSSVAGELVKGGVPAVIASNRNIMDHVSVAFAKEFYRVFSEGHPLEIALIEARKYLKYWDWDWSAYSLFVNRDFVNDLADIRIPNIIRGLSKGNGKR